MTNEQMKTSFPAVWQLPSENDWLVVESEFLTIAPAALYDYWIQPDLLCRWWPPAAELDPRVDGAYHLSWPTMHWHLRGYYTAVESGRRLAFTWKWDHDPELAPIRQVIIAFEARPTGGTRLTITHGPYSDSGEDQKERAGHLEGWTHFLGGLQNLLAKEQGYGL